MMPGEQRIPALSGRVVKEQDEQERMKNTLSLIDYYLAMIGKGMSYLRDSLEEPSITLRDGSRLPKELISIRQAAAILSRSKTSVYMMAKRGEIPTVDVGGVLRVPLKALRKWIEERTKIPGGPVA